MRPLPHRRTTPTTSFEDKQRAILMKMHYLLSLAIAIICGTTCPAQITFTISAEVDNVTGSSGFEIGDMVDFTFTTDASYATGSSNDFNTDYNFWTDYDPADDNLWSSVEASALTGTFTRLSSESSDPSSYLGSLPVDSTFILSASTDVSSDIGLLTPNGSAVRAIGIYSLEFDGSISETGTLTDIDAYFDTMAGDYLVTGGLLQIHTTAAGTIRLDPIGQTFSISTSAVPEPSTYAAIFGGIVLAGAVWRRNKPVRMNKTA